MPADHIARLRARPARAALRAVAAARRRRHSPATHLLLACAPKSGSTFLIEALLEITGFDRRNPLAAGYRHENNLYEPALIDAIGRNTVAQVHTLGSDHNLTLVNSYGLRPIVLVRDLADTVVSLRDHMRSESPRWSMVWADDRFSDLPDHRQLDMLIDLAAPWFINFFVSWTEASNRGDVSPFFLTYARLMDNPGAVLAEIADWAGVSNAPATIDRALATIDKRDTRLNAGVEGRGRQLLDAEQQRRLDRLATHYPSIDFTDLGISRPAT